MPDARLLSICGGAWWFFATDIETTLRENLEMSLITKTDVIWSLVTAGEITNAEFQDIRENMYFVPGISQHFSSGTRGPERGNVADPVDRLRADTDVGT